MSDKGKDAFGLKIKICVICIIRVTNVTCNIIDFSSHLVLNNM